MGWITYNTSITVPTGATTGRRIVIDGNTGQIVMYDINNRPVIVESSTTGNITINSTDGTSTMTIGRVMDPVFASPVPGISWASTAPPSAANGVISLAYDFGPLGDPTGYAELTPPRMSGDAAGTGKVSFIASLLQNDGNVVADSWWFWGEASGAQSSRIGQPFPYITDGNFHLFAPGEWPSVTQIVPPSATMDVEIMFTGHNAANIGDTIAVGFEVDLVSDGSLIQAASLSPNCAIIVMQVTGGTNNIQAYARVPVTSGALGGYIGQEVRITPAYRATNGSGAANVIVSVGLITVRPSVYGII